MLGFCASKKHLNFDLVPLVMVIGITLSMLRSSVFGNLKLWMGCGSYNYLILGKHGNPHLGCRTKHPILLFPLGLWICFYDSFLLLFLLWVKNSLICISTYTTNIAILWIIVMTSSFSEFLTCYHKPSFILDHHIHILHLFLFKKTTILILDKFIHSYLFSKLFHHTISKYRYNLD